MQRAHEGLKEVFGPNLLMLALCSWFTAFLVQGTGQHTHEGIRLHLLTVLQLTQVQPQLEVPSNCLDVTGEHGQEKTWKSVVTIWA